MHENDARLLVCVNFTIFPFSCHFPVIFECFMSVSVSVLHTRLPTLGKIGILIASRGRAN